MPNIIYMMGFNMPKPMKSRKNYNGNDSEITVDISYDIEKKMIKEK